MESDADPPTETARALLLTGANNHDWERSAPFCADLLRDAGLSVDLETEPERVLEARDIAATYDVLVLDYNGPDWSEAAEGAFERAVETGTGVVSLHAANNPFEGWEAFERMLGLLWREESGHGEYHEFDVDVTAQNHPITATIDDFRIWDELYHGLVNPHDVDYDVLASADSDPDHGGSGTEEPVAITRRYAGGRVFQCMLGHVWPGDPDRPMCTMRTFENDGFQELFVRGTQWAAGTEVTGTDV